MIGVIFSVLYAPTEWSLFANTYFYDFVGYVLQTAQAHNITIDGGAKYNVLPGNFTIIEGTGDAQNLASYALTAISGADDFSDDDTTVKDLFDAIVSTTREVTPTCKFYSSPALFAPLT